MPYWTDISRRRSTLVLLFLALVASCALAQSSAHPGLTSPGTTQPPPPKALPTLTTLREAHNLSAVEARRGYPIHVRATVTYFDAYIDPPRVMLFLHDPTGGIYVSVPQGFAWPAGMSRPGTLVDVSGVSAPGIFAPILDHPHFTVVGDSSLPANAKPVTLSKLLTGAEDGQWVEIEGVVHLVSEFGRNVTLRIAMDGGLIDATTLKSPGVDYQHLVDAWVHITGNAASAFNANHQATGVRMFFPGLETVTAEAPGPLDAFSLPVQPIDGLLRFGPARARPHRIHLRGAVTLYWPGRALCIDDGTEGLCAQTPQSTPLALGSLVDLVGFTSLQGYSPGLSDAVFRPHPGRHVLLPTPITATQAVDGTHDSRLVEIEGQLIGRDLASKDTVFLLDSGKSIFRAILPSALSTTILSTIPLGSSLRLVGVCSTLVDARESLGGYGGGERQLFWIMVRSPQSVVVVHTPSWWTAARFRLVLFFTLMITLAVAVWVFVLRRRVEQQTRELRESRELYRHMAHHDALTGLPTRVLLRDHLQTALERHRRFKKGVALLMLDVDKFKQVNDSHGHDCGDQVLRITAERLSAIIRKTDSIARMGGDEFIVLLNDLVDPGQAELVAAKIVAALSLPIRIGKIQVAVSVSVGVCTLSDATVDADTLLKRVDAAMYRAKASGRGCFQVFTNDLIDASRGQLTDAQSIAALKDERDLRKAPTSETVAL